MKSVLLWLLIALGGSLAPNSGAQYVFLNQLTSSAGTPCSYDSTGQQGSANCWGAGMCNPAGGNRACDVAWYQAWSCGENNQLSNYVHATGHSWELYQFGWDGSNWVSYPNGMYADGTAEVYNWVFYDMYQGWDEEDCDGFTSYGQPYSYVC
jgi:hypothetical protein